VRQKGPFGNATPIWNARSFIGDEPFLYLWADEFFVSDGPSRCQQLVKAYEELGASAILGSFKKNSPRDYKLWGYAVGTEISDGVLQVEHTVEKPGPGVIDSNYALFSPFVFGPEMVPAIGEAVRRLEADGSGRELYYVEGINILLEQGKKVCAVEMKDGNYYDCGSKLGYLKATVEMGLRHDDLSDEFKAYLKSLPL
jgi:UTP--glucose-1-phosphate uridylyltransferase